MRFRRSLAWLLPLLGGLSIHGCKDFDGPRFEHRSPTLPEIAGVNVLVVLLDDVGVDKISAYGEHPEAPATPTIDALAADGMLFRNAYANPVCSPSRAALLTGRYARRVGVPHNAHHEMEELELEHEEATLPEMLRHSTYGYTSVGVGKWHLVERSSQAISDPKTHGFDLYSGVLGNLRRSESYTDYVWTTNEGEAVRESRYLTAREVDEAIAHVRDLPEPWFMYLALHAPHGPWSAPPARLTGGEAVGSSQREQYDAMLTVADREIARLLAEVDLSDTLVLLIGDNGTPDETVTPPTSPLRAKNTPFEGGINVPFIAVGPGIAAGSESDALVHVVDVFPTAADAAGLEPNRPGVRVDGRSLWPVLLGREAEVHPYVFSEVIWGRQSAASRQALRDDRYKVIRSFDGYVGFFDLQGRHDDGPDLLEGALTPEQQAAFDALYAELERLDADITADQAQAPTGCGG